MNFQHITGIKIYRGVENMDFQHITGIKIYRG